MKTVVITGSNGGIGQALCEAFTKKNYYVIGVDLHEKSITSTNAYLCIDLNKVCNDPKYRDQSIQSLLNACENKLDVLINNAAIQVVAPVEQMSIDKWTNTININLSSIFILIKKLLPALELSNGSVINISSIHSKLTKADFSAYATSKAGLIGLTKALSVELGSRIKTNAISPAAISTSMLESGFEGDTEARKKLDHCHPSGKIGSVDDVVSAALYLSDGSNFLNGSIINIDGGISAKLHDPA